MENAACGIERRQQVVASTNVRGWTISEYGLSIVGSVRVSAAAEHHQAYVGGESVGAIGETAIRHFRASNREEKQPHGRRFEIRHV